jgi:SAM-dependent methyltransferase
MPSPPRADDASRYDRDIVAIEAARGVDVPGACPICGGSPARPRFAVEGLASRLVVCTQCGTGRVDPLPSATELAAFSPAEYYGDLGSKFRGPIESLVRLVGARHAKFLASGIPPGGRVLDVGCGRGVTLSALADHGFEPHGIELSAAAASGADPRAKIRIAPSLATAGYDAGSFDAVLVWHVLEHLRDPAGELAEMHRLLRPGGRLVVAVPNFSSWQARWAGPAWFHLDLPRHLYHFPVSALRALVVRSGFEITAEHHFSLRQNPFGWIQSALNRRRDLPRNGLYALLYQRSSHAPPPFPARVRRALWAGLVLGAAPAFALTLAESAFRSGATIHLVARKPPVAPSRS